MIEVRNTKHRVLFNENESLDIILQEVADQSTKVTLLNAIRYVPPEPVEATSLKKSNSMAAFSVIVLLMIAGLLIVGLIATICCCRRRLPGKVKPSNDQSQKHETTSAIKDECFSAPLPSKLKSRRTSSTTVTTTTSPVNSSSAVTAFPVENNCPVGGEVAKTESVRSGRLEAWVRLRPQPRISDRRGRNQHNPHRRDASGRTAWELPATTKDRHTWPKFPPQSE
uniref:Uncharacterized protein n=1 Tax=Panagrellus redivivus TaxID=6233 RepID=A0A7E4ZZG6_PANRE